ncbi:hypothetical protein [Roseovarius sp. 2305UL8-3]|uniref:hypothetical protein n=1 Tax=Roseovarius conchicola TaxID=3121636 RepID=UPI00352928A4
MTHVKRLFLGIAFCFASTAAWAVEPVQQHNSTAVWFENWTGLSNATLKVSAPNGEVITIHTVSGTPVFTLDSANAVDGIYRYSLSAATEEKEKVVNQLDSGRGDAQTDTAFKPFQTSGQFQVSRGVIITPEEINEDDG